MSNMERRAFLTLRRPEKPAAPAPAALPEGIELHLAARSAAPPVSGLAPYTGPWTRAEALHLLRRTQFTVSKAELDYFLGLGGMEAAVDELLAPAYTPPPVPVNDYNNPDFTDPAVPFGETFIDAAYENAAEGYRVESLRAWWIRQMIGSKRNIREKMTLFWHNHMPVQFYEIYFGGALYRYVNTLRENALGNFKTLVRSITLDPSMLFFLNGYLNSVYAPDENYAREVQELFVIGKDLPQYYTEDDVKAAARLLTGWRTNGFDTVFFVSEHDKNDKKFSAFYNNRVIKGQSGPDGGAAELDEFIDMLFDHPEAARYICRKLYRFFVYHDIAAQTETDIIEPLAQILRDNNFEILPVLHTLFKSEHFFDALNHGVIIKSPVDLGVGLFRQFDVKLPGNADPLDNFILSLYLGYTMNDMLQYPGEPPNVAGWQAYYQKPFLDKMWINTGTLPKRGQFTEAMVYYGFFGFNNVAVIDALAWAAALGNPAEPDALIDEATFLLLGLPVSAEVKKYLKTILLSDLPSDYYWTIAWNAWVADPGNDVAKGVIETRLKAFLWVLLQFEEYQLS